MKKLVAILLTLAMALGCCAALAENVKSEYNVDIVRTALPYRLARWVKSDVAGFDAKDMTLTSTSLLVLDRDDEPVVLFESEWAVDWAVDHNKDYELRFDNIHDKNN